jgi:hypothetical protein
MPYLVASIMTIVTAMTILFTRYEADDSTIKAELENMRVMFSMVDGFVNTYVDSGGNLPGINFEVLADSSILFNIGTTDNSTRITPTAGDGFETTMRLPSSEVIWHLIPNIADASSYKLLVNMNGSSGLMSKAIFSESFSGREFCEKSLFGTFETNRVSYDIGTADFLDNTGSNNDGLFVCVVYK